MKVGFTGTRRGMTDSQKFIVWELLREFRSDIFKSEFRHGNCIGADEQALEIATDLDYTTFAYPSNLPAYTSQADSHYYRIPEHPLNRNRHIVRDSDVLIATPYQRTEPISKRGSGTWHAIGCARKQNLRRKIYIIWPDGEVTIEND